MPFNKTILLRELPMRMWERGANLDLGKLFSLQWHRNEDLKIILN